MSERLLEEKKKRLWGGRLESLTRKGYQVGPPAPSKASGFPKCSFFTVFWGYDHHRLRGYARLKTEVRDSL